MSLTYVAYRLTECHRCSLLGYFRLVESIEHEVLECWIELNIEELSLLNQGSNIGFNFSVEGTEFILSQVDGRKHVSREKPDKEKNCLSQGRKSLTPDT